MAKPPELKTSIAKQWIEQPLELLEECSKLYGDIFTLHLGALGPTVFLSHPKAVEEIFKRPSSFFECHQFNVSYRPLMGDNALFLQNGPAHQRLRRIMMPPFHGERIKGYADIVCLAAQDFIESCPKNESFPLRLSMHKMALRILMAIVFGTRQEPIGKITNWFETEIFKEPKGWKPWFNYARLQPEIRNLIAHEVELTQGMDLHSSEDLLSWLQLAQDEDGNHLSIEELEDQILTLLITAVDPVAMGLTWALYWIHKIPEVQQKLREELADLGQNPDPLSIIQLPYLGAICQETLRIHPILPTVSGRRLTSKLEVMGYELEEGITVAPCAYLVHRREELYPEPDQFKPERFLERQFTPYEYFPFGGGDRRCLGSALAPFELKLIIATILSNSSLSLVNQEPLTEVRYGTLVAPSEKLQMLVT